MNNDTNARESIALQQFVGESEWTTMVRERIRQVAKHRYGVLVTGPSGTGKELIARAVHTCSDRRDQPFVPVNCAAIPPGLFSSQLFGHLKGAFTGAQYASMGCFRAAHGGTIFLDEIGELDMDCQAKLLRVLQERTVTPVGSAEEVAVDVRTIAATNRDLAAEVRAGRFRLDLFYRLNVISIESKGLELRRDDILPLANHFLATLQPKLGRQFKGYSREAENRLLTYSWPGNVRELRNVVERAMILERSEEIQANSLILDQVDLGTSTEESAPAAAIVPLEQMERDLVARAMQATGNNQTRAAELLEVTRDQLRYRLKKFGLD